MGSQEPEMNDSKLILPKLNEFIDSYILCRDNDTMKLFVGIVKLFRNLLKQDDNSFYCDYFIKYNGWRSIFKLIMQNNIQESVNT